MLLTGAESDGGYKVALAICQALRKSAPARTRNGALARVVSPWGEGRGGVWRLEPQPGERATCPGPPHRRLRCADRVHLPGAWGVRGHAQREGLPRHGLNRHRPMGMRTERSTTSCAAPSQQDRWSSREHGMHLPGNGALPTCPSQCHVVVFAASTVHGNAAHRRRRGPRCQRMPAGPAWSPRTSRMSATSAT